MKVGKFGAGHKKKRNFLAVATPRCNGLLVKAREIWRIKILTDARTRCIRVRRGWYQSCSEMIILIIFK
jgi:hypothetical protein